MELKITKEKVLETVKNCPESEKALRTMFPEAFPENYFNKLMGNKSSIPRDNVKKALCGIVGDMCARLYIDLGFGFLSPEERAEKMAKYIIKGMEITELSSKAR